MDMTEMKREFELRRAAGREVLRSVSFSGDLYATAAVLCLQEGVRTEAAEAQLKFTAEWFEHPHPNGRNHRGEADFAAIGMVPILCDGYDRLSEDCRAALDRFFLERDYRSMHGSENHAIMARVARLLAAEFYTDRQFVQYGKSAEEIRAEDEAYIDEFLMYRAGRAWGEFDSLGYGAEDLSILNTLFTYTKNDRLRKKAGMMLDMVLLDMIVDSKEGIYGGAHGRSYPEAVLDSTFSSIVTHGKAHFYHSTMYGYYCYYFGAEGGRPAPVMTHASALTSPYYPSEMVCRVAKCRKLPYENRERKHLHVMTAWDNGINRRELALVEGLSIDKYIYVCEDYMLGSITHQDAYPKGLICAWYAHHQQHEWELTLPGDGRAKIFTHHPGDPGEYKIHNRWTGDSFCNCGTHFCTRDTAISMYNIKGEKEFPYINADVPLEFFRERREAGNFLFLRHGKIFIMLWFANGYHYVTEGETAGYELLSDGRQHAVVCHVAKTSAYGDSIDTFAAAMQAEAPRFDAESMTVKFRDIRMDYENRWVKGEKQVFPYKNLYESPWLWSEYGSGVLHISDGEREEILDFNF